MSAKFDYIKSPDFSTNALSQHAQGGLLVTTFVNKDYYSINLVNEQLSSIFNLTRMETENIISKNLLDYIHKDDIQTIKQLFSNNIDSTTPFSCNCRIKIRDKNLYVVAMIVAKKEFDETKFYIISRPTIELNSKNKTNPPTKNKGNCNYPIFGTHRNEIDNIFSIIDVSEDFSKFLGYTKNELIKATNNDFSKLIYKDDIPYFESSYNKLMTSRPKKSLSYRLLNKQNQILWVIEHIEISTDTLGNKHIFAKVCELDNLNKDIYPININENQLPPPIDSKLLIVDLVNRRFETDIFAKSKIKFKKKYVENLPNSLIENNIIFEEDKKNFLKFSENVLSKQKNEWIGRICLKNNKIGWYHILSYTLFNNGMPIKALCILINISSNKKMKENFNKQQEIIHLVISDYEFFGEYDLLTNVPIYMYSPTTAKDFYEDAKFNNFEFCINNVIHKDDVSTLLKQRDINIAQVFNNTIPENHELQVRFRSLSNRFEGYQWYNVKYIYQTDKDTKHLHLTLLIKNIDKTKRNEIALLENITQNN